MLDRIKHFLERYDRDNRGHYIVILSSAKHGFRYRLDTGDDGEVWLVKDSADPRQWNLFASVRAFAPFAGAPAEILCVRAERVIGNDDCVRYAGLGLQIPEQAHRHPAHPKQQPSDGLRLTPDPPYALRRAPLGDDRGAMDVAAFDAEVVVAARGHRGARVDRVGGTQHTR